MVAKFGFAFLTVLALLPNCARAQSGDAKLDRLVQSYREDGVVDPWDGSWLQGGLFRKGRTASVPADMRMGEILAVFTRDRLDAGGWVNSFVGEPHYAAGNDLVAVAIGDRVISGH